MFGSIDIGRVLGIPVRVHITLILVLPLFSVQFARVMGDTSFFWGLLAAIGLFVSVAIHELGHAVTAMRKGIRVTQILLLPIGGLAQLARMPSKPQDEFQIAAAGPITSMILAILCWVIGNLLAVLQLPSLGLVFLMLAVVNLVLAIFNLLPSFPMDGGRIFRAWMTPRIGRVAATRLAVRIGRFMAILLGIWGIIQFNLITVAIAIFVYVSAGAEERVVLLQERMRGGFREDSFTDPKPEMDDDNVIVSPPPYARTDDRARNRVRLFIRRQKDRVDQFVNDWMRR